MFFTYALVDPDMQRFCQFRAMSMINIFIKTMSIAVINSDNHNVLITLRIMIIHYAL